MYRYTCHDPVITNLSLEVHLCYTRTYLAANHDILYQQVGESSFRSH